MFLVGTFCVSCMCTMFPDTLARAKRRVRRACNNEALDTSAVEGRARRRQEPKRFLAGGKEPSSDESSDSSSEVELPKRPRKRPAASTPSAPPPMPTIRAPKYARKEVKGN